MDPHLWPVIRGFVIRDPISYLEDLAHSCSYRAAKLRLWRFFLLYTIFFRSRRIFLHILCQMGIKEYKVWVIESQR